MLVNKLRELHPSPVRAIQEAEDMLRKTASLVLIVAFLLVAASGFFLLAVPGEASPALASSRSIEAQKISSPITIDGDLADWPAVPALTLDATTAQYVAGGVTDPLDLSLSLVMVWDSQYLYVGAIVSDSTLIADSSNVWDDDSIEISLDGARDGRCCGVDDHQFTVTLDGRLADFGSVIAAGTSPVSSAVTMLPAGYRVEMAIPLTRLTGAPVVSGTVMGVNAALNDDDDGGRRDKRFV